MSGEEQGNRTPSAAFDRTAAAASGTSARSAGRRRPRSRELRAYRCRVERRDNAAMSGAEFHRQMKRRRSGCKNTVLLGTGPQGRRLMFSHEQCAFALGDKDIPLAEVRALDAAGLIEWRYMEQRDWMRHLDEPKVAELHSAYLASHLGSGSKSAADAYIADHVRKDNSYLHGHIVEEPPKPEGEKPEEPEEEDSAEADAAASAEKQSENQSHAKSAKSKEPKGFKRRVSNRVEKLLFGDPEKEPTIGEIAEKEKAEHEESKKKKRKKKSGEGAGRDRAPQGASDSRGMPTGGIPRA